LSELETELRTEVGNISNAKKNINEKISETPSTEKKAVWHFFSVRAGEASFICISSAYNLLCVDYMQHSLCKLRILLKSAVTGAI
jgi:hypothetical protein